MTTRGLRSLTILFTTAAWLGLGACEGDNPGPDPESHCHNGVDDDDDGLTDCEDPDCVPTAQCQVVCDQNGSCDVGEDRTNCPEDCVVCDDGFCDPGEDRVSCPGDCVFCDDSFCDAGEDRTNCPEDCAVCDDGHCDPGEDRTSCQGDCVACDDGFCDAGEDRAGCPEDCAVCDDSFCDPGEDRASCPEDCAECGDAVCDTNEDRLSCPDDCILCGDTFCDTGETIANCPEDCATVLVDEDFSSWVPSGWTATGWLHISSGSTDWAQCTNACIAQDALLESLTFSTLGYSNVWVSFTQDYQFAGTGVRTGLYVDAPPDYYTIAQPTDLPVGEVVYDISAEAANRASVQLELAVWCDNTSQCFLNDHWRVTDVLVWVF